jgi:hypothetical protein
MSAGSWFRDAPVAQAERARAEAGRQPDLPTWWRGAERADWMVWAAGRADVDLRLVVQAAADCVRTALPAVDEAARPVATAAVDAVFAWVEGRVGPRELRAADAAVAREAERSAPIPDPTVAAGSAAALGAVTALVQAAVADDRRRTSELAADAVRRVAATEGRLAGPEAAGLAQERCADLVRARIPARLLPA